MCGDNTMATSSGVTMDLCKKASSPSKNTSRSVWVKESSHADFVRAAKETTIFESKMSKKSKLLALDVKRYFTVTENYIYYKKKKEGTIKGVLRLEDARIVILPNKKGFILNKDNNKSKLMVSDPNTFEIWRKTFARKCIFLNSFENEYELKASLGSGSFASVFLLERKNTKELFAGKIFIKRGDAENQRIKRNLVLSEVHILRRLDHNNFLKLEEVHETEEEIIIISEFLRGGTLRKFILNTSLPSEKRRKLISQLLTILEYLNTLKITHRDFKPENLMLREDETLVLIDFGLAVDFSNKKRVGSSAGTIGYIAPEILACSNKVSPDKIDLYSVGCILFELITGMPLFIGPYYKDLLLMNSKNSMINLRFGIGNAGVDEREFILTQSFLKNDPELRPSLGLAKSLFEKQI